MWRKDKTMDNKTLATFGMDSSPYFDLKIGAKLAFSQDVLLWKSEFKIIGKTAWMFIVYERPDVYHYSTKSTHSEKYTGFLYWDGERWEREFNHQKYDTNDGSYAGLPKGLVKLFHSHKSETDKVLS
jgi:hypothetical protein